MSARQLVFHDREVVGADALPIVKATLRAGETLRLDPPGFDVAVSDLLGTGG